MGKTIKDYYDMMVLEKQSMGTLNQYQPNIDSSQTLLADLTTKSKVAIWRLEFWVVACCAYAVDVVCQLSLAAMTVLVNNSRYGTEPWYVDVAKKFQYGDQLTQVNLEFVYNPVDTAKQIIALAAAKEGVGVVNVKVAKLVSDVPTKLATLEKDAFIAYMQQRKPSGININVISDDPDELRLYITAKYDPLVLKSTGESISTPGTYPLVDNVNAYLKGLDFDGKFDLMKLVDNIQDKGGIGSVYVTNASARYGANPFVDFDEDYYPNAGYLVIDPTNPLSTTTTYEPNV